MWLVRGDTSWNHCLIKTVSLLDGSSRCSIFSTQTWIGLHISPVDTHGQPKREIGVDPSQALFVLINLDALWHGIRKSVSQELQDHHVLQEPLVPHVPQGLHDPHVPQGLRDPQRQSEVGRTCHSGHGCHNERSLMMMYSFGTLLVLCAYAATRCICSTGPRKTSTDKAMYSSLQCCI